MALSAAMQWEVRTAGSDTLCSGGFVAGASGTDYSQQNAAQYTGTNLVIDGAVNTKVTSATHNFVAADVGNTLRITAGSGFTTGVFEIVSVAANAATLDRSAGTLGSTAGTFAVGGALLSPGIASLGAVASNTIWIKSGTYSITSATLNVAGGCMGAGGIGILTRGYGTTRGDDAARPVLQASGISSATIYSSSGQSSLLAWNIECDGAGLSSIRGYDISASSSNKVYYCVARNCTNNGFNLGSAYRCYATGCTTNPAFTGGACVACEANTNSGGGFQNNIADIGFLDCLAYGNSFGFSSVNNASIVIGCTAYNNTTAGFTLPNSPQYAIINCVSYGNGTYGYDGGVSTTYFSLMLNCAGGANSTADRRPIPPTWIDNFITLTADPFVNKAGGNFALNNTAGGGAALRALAIPGVFPGATTTGYLDIGAAQHQDSGGGGGGTGPNVIVSSGAGSRGGSW